MDTGLTYIYSLSHPLTGEVRYVGKADNLKLRMYGHLNGKDITHKRNWISLLKKDGLLPTIELIDTVEKSNWQFWEQYYISLFKSWGFDLVNGTYGGDGRTDLKHSDETKAKMSASLKEAYKNPEIRKKISDRLKGRKLSQETKDKLSKINSGKPPYFGATLSDEAKAKISATHKGKVVSEDSRKRMSLGQKNKSYRPSETTLKKMSDRMKGNKYLLGHKHSEDTRKKISESLKANSRRRKEVPCLAV